MKLRLGGAGRPCGPGTLLRAATFGAALALTSLLALDTAWSQNTPPQPQPTTRTQTLKEDPATTRRRVDAARRKTLETERATAREATDRAQQRMMKAAEEHGRTLSCRSSPEELL